MANHTQPELSAIADLLRDRFEITASIGSGGQATVYRGVRFRTQDGTQVRDDVALKIYSDPSQDTRVMREIAAMTQVRHYSLANLLEHGVISHEQRQFKYIAWEFIPGEPLNVRIRAGAIPPRIVAVIGRDVGLAIDAVWSRRIVHRDVNPKNIMLRTGDQGAVLIDLGIAKYLDQTPLTAPGIAWGTNGYLSPEQHSGFPLTCQSDVFSLGIALQEALTGHHPTNGNQQLLTNRGGPTTATIQPAAPAGLAGLLDAMVRLRPAHRPTPRTLAEKMAEIAESL